MATKAITMTIDEVNAERARTLAAQAGLSLSAYVDRAIRRENSRWYADNYAAWLNSDDPAAIEHRRRRAAAQADGLARLDAAHEHLR